MHQATVDSVMFRPPKLTFYNLPDGIKTPLILDVSKVGFAVLFLPESISVTTFDVTADSRF
jgi:hypothetical protein